MKPIKLGIYKEIDRRYSLYADEEIRKGYSLQDLSDAMGEENLIYALFNEQYIRKCKCCGRLFVARRLKECYCNELYDGKHTCKDVGPSLTRNQDEITVVMDKARRLHLWRRSRSGKTESAQRKYEEWLEFAKTKEEACRKGEITVDELRNVIGTGYTKDASIGGLE